MVRTFEILFTFFNIRSSVPVFLFFFQMKLSSKIVWVSLNSFFKKMFEFDSNIFRHFKHWFFKVLATNVVADGMSLMLNREWGSLASHSTSSLIPPGSSCITRIC